jgi:hypothetical protein
MAADGDITRVNFGTISPKGGRKAMFKNRWWIAGASAMALIFSSGTIQLFSASLFIKPITEELGFGRGTLSTAFGINFILSAIATPIFGRLLDLRARLE